MNETLGQQHTGKDVNKVLRSNRDFQYDKPNGELGLWTHQFRSWWMVTTAAIGFSHSIFCAFCFGYRQFSFKFWLLIVFCNFDFKLRWVPHFLLLFIVFCHMSFGLKTSIHYYSTGMIYWTSWPIGQQVPLDYYLRTFQWPMRQSSGTFDDLWHLA